MTGPTDPWERAMTRELDDRASGLDAQPFTLDDVRGRAHGIRRTRRLAAAGGALAAIAVLAPVGLLATDGATRTDGPPVATTSPSPSPTVADDGSDSEPPDGTPAETAPGTALGFSWISGRTLTTPDGDTVRLPASYQSAAALGDGLIASYVVDNPGNDPAVDVVEGDGTFRSGTLASSTVIATNAAHTVGAYLGFGQLHVAGSTGGSQGLNAESDPLPRDVTPVAVTGECAPQAAGGEAAGDPASTGTCRVYFNDGGSPEAPVGVMEPDGSISPVPFAGAVLQLADVSDDGLVAAQTSSSDAGSCSAVDRDGAELWSTCDYSFYDFSPDGSYLAATDAYRDGFGQGWVAILDATSGEEVARYEADGASLTDAVWVSGSGLVMPGYGAEGWTLASLDADGTSAVVARTSRGDDLTPGFVIPDQG